MASSRRPDNYVTPGNQAYSYSRLPVMALAVTASENYYIAEALITDSVIWVSFHTGRDSAPVHRNVSPNQY